MTPLIYADPTGNWCTSADGKWSRPGACNGGIEGKEVYGNYNGSIYSEDIFCDGCDIIENGKSVDIFAYDFSNDSVTEDNSIIYDLIGGAGTLLGKAGAKLGIKLFREFVEGAIEAASRKSIIKSATQARRGGETVVGHALQKHAGRNPDIWGKVKGGPDQINQAAMKHLEEILDAPGGFIKVTNSRGIIFLEKKLPDGRGVRLNQNGIFKGFIDK